MRRCIAYASGVNIVIQRNTLLRNPEEPVMGVNDLHKSEEPVLWLKNFEVPRSRVGLCTRKNLYFLE